MTEPSLPEESLFARAREIESAAERAAFLDRACVDDRTLRVAVEELLRADVQTGDLLDLPDGPALTLQESAIERPGGVIGPYKLLQVIGEGGMGTVYMAEQTTPVKRVVALKVIKPGMDSRQVLARFGAERQALALMDHPNIAKVLDAGATDQGRPYFVMELVKAVPITRYCDEKRLTPRERLELLIPVCQAVQHAHQKGIIHRDLKPSNVVVGLYDGEPVPKIIDFGVAKATGPKLTEATLFTGFGAVIGTPDYMSPEQAQLDNVDVDTRSDIYSLGVLLYELLTGTTPLEGKRSQTAPLLDVLRVIREEEPPRPSLRVSDLGSRHTLSAADDRTGRMATTLAEISALRQTEPAKLTKLMRGDLDWIVMKALEKDRNRRYESANALALDIERYLREEPVTACPPSTWYRLQKLVRRNRVPVVAALVVVLALVSGIVGTTWGMLRATRAQAEAVAESWHKEKALRDKEKALRTAQETERARANQLWQVLLAQARANRLSRGAGQRVETLKILREATGLARTLNLPDERFHELRNAVIATLALPDMHVDGPSHPWPADAIGFDFDEAHAIYARTDRKGCCSVRRVADDVEIQRLPGTGYPRLSRDGKFVALVDPNKVMDLWHLAGVTPCRLLSEAEVWAVDFHRDGQRIAVTYKDGAIALFELPSGRPLYRLPAGTLTFEVTVALHPREPVFAAISYRESVVQLREMPSGKLLASLPQGTSPLSIAWHPDGQTLAVGLGKSELIRLYDRATLQLIRTLESSQPVSLLSFNKAGDRLVAAGWRCRTELFDVGTGQKLFEGPYAFSAPLRFNRDDRRLSGEIRDGKLGTLELGDGRELRRLVRKAKPAKAEIRYPASVSPDGRLIAAAMTDGFGFWDLASGSELAFVTAHGTNNCVLFEPSGALLTLSPTGLSRWPVRREAASRNHLMIGPPEQLPLPRGQVLGQSADGRVIVTCSRALGADQDYAGGWILHADRPGEPIRLDAGADVGFITVSPDGRWVVTVTHLTGLAKVWDARDGTLVKPLIEYGAGYPRFSSDSRWLSTELDGGRLVAVGTWKPGPRPGGCGQFSADGKLMAIETTPGVVPLVDPMTGREIARLESPDDSSIDWPFFTRDGTRLISIGNGILVWDLRLIRQHLAELGLDWDAPPYPPAELAGKAVAPLKVEVRLGDSAQLALLREQKGRQDIEHYRRALESNPECPATSNSLAWSYLTAPEALRDVKAASSLAEKAVRLRPEDGVFVTTLGVAYYRDGRYREAIEVLRPSLDTQEDRSLAIALCFLAMSHERLGETARAKDYYAWAVRWIATQKDLPAEPLEELRMLRAEAEEVLGIDRRHH